MGRLRIDAGDLEEYVGSRAKGEEVRTRTRSYRAAGAQQVVLDLANVGVVSSSFADEVVGKLAIELGELEYWSMSSAPSMAQSIAPWYTDTSTPSEVWLLAKKRFGQRTPDATNAAQLHE